MSIRTIGTDDIKVRRGEIHWVERPADTYGSEMQKSRPAVVVSNNAQNETSPTIQVVYMTNQPKTDLPTHVKLNKTSNGKSEGSTVLCENIYTISKQRLQEGYSYGARVSDEDMEAIDNALIVALGLDDYFEEDEKEYVDEDIQKAKADLAEMTTVARFYKMQYNELLDRIMKR